MNRDSEGYSVLRERAWASLVQRLDALAAADATMGESDKSLRPLRLRRLLATTEPTMGEIRDKLLRPLRLLQILAVETPGALGQDVLAAERLRNLLYLASPWSALVTEAEQLLDEAKIEPVPHARGVIDLSMLTLIAIAAIRVAPTKLLARIFLQTVHGLALSATPAEMLGEMEPYGHESAPLREVVKLMVLPEAGRLRENRLFLPRFALDPLSLGRWHCLRTILSGGIDGSLDAIWAPPDRQYAVLVDSIEAIHPIDAEPGSELTLTGHFAGLTTKRFPKALHVVFASASGAPIEAAVLAFSRQTITVRVPAGATAGWIGLADDRLIAEANHSRRAIRRLLTRLSAAGDGFPARVAPIRLAGCLDGAIPTAWLADLHGLPVPPRTASNRYAGGAPSSNTFNIASAKWDDDRPRASALVLFRPAIVESEGDRVEIGGMQKAGLRLLASHGRGLSAIELPWIEDRLAVLSTAIRSQDDPRIARLLGRLSRAALQTPGFEQALWLMVVPGQDPIAVSKPAEAAAAVAVATLSGLPALFEELARVAWRPADRTAMQRLRVVGHIDQHAGLCVDDSRIEAAPRLVGPGATVDSGYVAVAVDSTDHDLHSQPITCLTSDRPSGFELLFPITPEVAAVELRNSRRTVAAIRRTDGAPEIVGPGRTTHAHRPELRREVLHWQYRHPLGLRSRPMVEVSRDGVWAAFTELDACRDEEVLPLHRLQQIDQMRIVASDGWHATERSFQGRVNGRPPVVARRVNDTQWWADVGDSWSVIWHVPGLAPQRTRALAVPEGTVGTVKLVATDEKTGEIVTDERPLRREEP